MREKFWRWGIPLLSLFLLWGIGNAQTTHDKTVPLKWYDLETGELYEKDGKTDIEFELRINKDCKGEITCTIGDGEEAVELKENCTEVDKSNVEKKDNGVFSVKGHEDVSVKCVNDKGETVSTLDEAQKFLLEGSPEITRTWDTFVLANPGEKAIPWDGSMAKCPDPLGIKADGTSNEAYVLQKDENGYVGAVLPETAHRSVLNACGIVVDSYLQACRGAAGEKGDEITKMKNSRTEETKALQMKEAKKWILASTATVKDSDCPDENSWWKSSQNKSQNKCLTQWNKIKSRTPSYFDARIGMQDPFPDIDLYKTIKAFWKSGTLEQFLWKEAEKDYDLSSHKSELLAREKEQATIEEFVAFLQKRLDNIRLANTLSQTRTFEVSKWLTRNADSKESDLTAFGGENENNIFNKIIRLVIQVFGSLGVLLLIISGFMMVVSRGEEAILGKAKQTFMYTLIGLVIGFASYTIVRFFLEILLIR